MGLATSGRIGTAALICMTALIASAKITWAQESLPWEQPSTQGQVPSYGADRAYEPPPSAQAPPRGNEAYRPPEGYGSAPPPAPRGGYSAGEYGQPYQAPGGGGYGGGYDRGPQPYGYDPQQPPPRSYQDNRYAAPYQPPPPGYAPPPPYEDRTYSESEIVAAGKGFFGSVSKELAKVVEQAFRKSGRPNGYILGEDAGVSFVVGVRYGKGVLHTKDAGSHRVYWQGPSVGYDFGAEGSKVMVLVYNLRSPDEIYERYGGIQGSAYVVGGVGIQFLKRDHVTVAPIRAGVGLKLGANVGYLHFTRNWSGIPF